MIVAAIEAMTLQSPICVVSSLFCFFVLPCSSEGVFEFVDSVRFAGVKHGARVWKRDDY